MNPSTVQNYIEILEKTNQQLSLWNNPYGIMVGILTVIIALMAIFFAYILYRQGKDYKDFLAEQKKIIEGETKKSLDSAKCALDEQIKNGEEKLKELKGTTKETIEKEINNLKKVRDSIENVQTIPIVSASSIASLSNLRNNFTYNIDTAVSNAKLHFENFTCPSCGNYNFSYGKYCPHCGKQLK